MFYNCFNALLKTIFITWLSNFFYHCGKLRFSLFEYKNYHLFFFQNKLIAIDFLAATIQELHSTFTKAIEVMKNSRFPVTAVASGCELFMRFITLASLDNKNFQQCKQVMLVRGELFLEKLNGARDKVAKLASNFITDGSVRQHVF